MITLLVNGQSHVYEGEASLPLVVYLRDVLKIETVRYGCLMGSCKSCLVYVDEARCQACSVSMDQMEGCSVVTAPQW